MDWIDTNSLISICTFAIGLTQFLFWRYIAKQKSYETEKGKNLATKEDIGEITKEIETVKNTFTIETEKLKAKLTLFTNVQYGIISEERNAIIEFVKSLYNLESSIFKTPTKITDNKAIEREMENMDNAHYALKCAQALFNLYIEDDELKIEAINLIKYTVNQIYILQNAYGEIMIKNIEIELRRKEVYENTTAKRDIMKKVFQERQEIYTNAREKTTNLYSSYIKDRAIFENKCRTRIYKLLEPEH